MISKTHKCPKAAQRTAKHKSVPFFSDSFSFLRVAMCLSMVCPTWHTLGRCWRKKGNLALESSPRGWYLVGIVKTSRKIHEQLRLDDHYIWFIYEFHSNCIYILFHYVKVSLENSTDTHISRSHTVNKREICGTCKGYVGGCDVGSSPRNGGFSL